MRTAFFFFFFFGGSWTGAGLTPAVGHGGAPEGVEYVQNMPPGAVLFWDVVGGVVLKCQPRVGWDGMGWLASKIGFAGVRMNDATCVSRGGTCTDDVYG